LRFGGFAEFSSFWLGWMQIFQAFPQLIKAYPNTYQVFRVNFCIWFIVFRLGFWQIWQYGLYQDLYRDLHQYGFSMPLVLNFVCWTALWVLQYIFLQ
jgi:hypothetical protein